MSSPADQVVLLPLGDFPAPLLRTLAADIEATLGLSVTIAEPLPLPQQAFRPERGQYVSSRLLGAIRKAGRTKRLLGVTEADLFAPGLNFVFGEAELGGRAAVISTCRLREEFWNRAANAGLLRRRALIEAIHELGHTWGLGHCSRPACVMRFSNTLADTDRKGPALCPRCRALLPWSPA